jgi:hypothetical protein
MPEELGSLSEEALTRKRTRDPRCESDLVLRDKNTPSRWMHTEDHATTETRRWRRDVGGARKTLYGSFAVTAWTQRKQLTTDTACQKFYKRVRSTKKDDARIIRKTCTRGLLEPSDLYSMDTSMDTCYALVLWIN